MKRPVSGGTAIRVGLGVLVTLVCLALAFRSVPFGELLDELTDVHVEWLVVTLVAQLASLVARAARASALLHGRIGLLDAFWPQSVGLLLTHLFPLRAGEAARVFLVSRRAGLPVAHVGAMMLLENVLDVLMLVLLLVALIPLMPVPTIALTAGLGLGGVVGVLALGMILAVLLNERAERLAGLFGHLVPRRIRELVGRQWSGALAGLGAFGSPGVAAKALGYSVLVWALAIASFWSAIESVVPGGAPIEAAFAVAWISLGSVVPSTPGSIGVYEFIGQQALLTSVPGRYTPASALTVALLTHAQFYLLTIVLGAVALVRLGVSLGGVRRAPVPEAAPVE